MSNTTAEKVMAVSQIYRDLAGTILNTAYKAYTNGSISERDFWLIRMDYYEPLLREGMKILMNYDHHLAAEVSDHLDLIESETKRLNKAIETIEKIDSVTNVFDKALTAATKAAMFMLDPSATAAASVVSAIGETISETKN